MISTVTELKQVKTSSETDLADSETKMKDKDKAVDRERKDRNQIGKYISDTKAEGTRRENTGSLKQTENH